jgi:hypothetical protein
MTNFPFSALGLVKGVIITGAAVFSSSVFLLLSLPASPLVSSFVSLVSLIVKYLVEH